MQPRRMAFVEQQGPRAALLNSTWSELRHVQIADIAMAIGLNGRPMAAAISSPRSRDKPGGRMCLHAARHGMLPHGLPSISFRRERADDPIQECKDQFDAVAGNECKHPGRDISQLRRHGFGREQPAR